MSAGAALRIYREAIDNAPDQTHSTLFYLVQEMKVTRRRMNGIIVMTTEPPKR
jgi:hypothetical protein